MIHLPKSDRGLEIEPPLADWRLQRAADKQCSSSSSRVRSFWSWFTTDCISGRAFLVCARGVG
jgi:hypothetical protein